MSVPTATIAAALAAAAACPGEPPSGVTAAVASEALAVSTSSAVSLVDPPPVSGADRATDGTVGATAAANDKAGTGEAEPGNDEGQSRRGRKDIIVEGDVGPPPGDPLQGVNVQTFEVVQAVDKALVEPVAHGYMAVFPKPVRDGIHNVVTNLDEPIVFLSFLLQLKPIQALKTLGRFAVNSTIGLAGLIDVAKRKPFNHPHVENGFGHTLAYYGVKPGPFLYLPLIGSTTLRDLIGQLAQIPVLPLAIGKPFNDPLYVIPKFTVSAIDERAQDDPRIQQIRSRSSNPYSDYRSYYLRKRQAEVDVLKGLRKDAEVPVFVEDAPEAGDSLEPADKGAMHEPGETHAEAGALIETDDAVALAE